VQAVYAHGSNFYCFVYDAGSWEAREIKPGPTNDKFFVIQSGLNEGDQVALNPRAYRDEVDLPKLSPGEAQRAVPQRGNGRGQTDADESANEDVGSPGEPAPGEELDGEPGRPGDRFREAPGSTRVSPDSDATPIKTASTSTSQGGAE